MRQHRPDNSQYSGTWWSRIWYIYKQFTGLTPGITYYVRAYATNSAGTAYGNEITFTTNAIVVPTLTTAIASAITQTSATSGGIYQMLEAETITARGVAMQQLPARQLLIRIPSNRPE